MTDELRDPLGVAPGRPRAAGDDDADPNDTQPPLVEANPLDLLGAEPVEQETVEDLLGAWWMLLHYTVGRGGPPDAFVPTEQELGQMARPAARIVNRSARAQMIARQGDVVSFAMQAGTYAVRESRRVADYKQRQAELDEQAPPDSELANIATVRERPSGAVRPRPPAAPGSTPRFRPPAGDVPGGEAA